MNRRRFLMLLGTGLCGLFLPRTGLIHLSRSFLLVGAGECAFCGKPARRVRGLAGVVGLTPRICDECLHLCLDIIGAEDLREAPARAPPLPGEAFTADAEEEAYFRAMFSDASLEDVERLLDSLRSPRTSEAAAVPPARPSGHSLRLSCSFCGASQADVRKLIAGPAVYVCDTCVFEAVAMLERNGIRLVGA